jgi:hypothetical protein
MMAETEGPIPVKGMGGNWHPGLNVGPDLGKISLNICPYLSLKELAKVAVGMGMAEV